MINYNNISYIYLNNNNIANWMASVACGFYQIIYCIYLLILVVSKYFNNIIGSSILHFPINISSYQILTHLRIRPISPMRDGAQERERKKRKKKEKNKVHSLTDGIHQVGVCWSCRLNTKAVFSSRKSLGLIL